MFSSVYPVLQSAASNSPLEYESSISTSLLKSVTAVPSVYIAVISLADPQIGLLFPLSTTLDVSFVRTVTVSLDPSSAPTGRVILILFFRSLSTQPLFGSTLVETGGFIEYPATRSRVISCADWLVVTQEPIVMLSIFSYPSERLEIFQARPFLSLST